MKKKITIVKHRIKKIFEHHKNDIITLSYSGGKDSSFLFLCASEVIMENPNILNNQLYLIYSDTGVEIPELREYVLRTISKFKGNEKLSKYIQFHIVRPLPKDNFFVKMIEEGYPSPHVKFRWCTRVLKTKPINNFLEELKKKGKPVVKIIGVREEESTMRQKGAYEIGIEKSKKEIPVYAPIKDLTTEEIWVGLSYFCGTHPLWSKKDLEELKKIYGFYTNFRKKIRHGCWVCTVISPLKDDKALLSLAESLNVNYLLKLNELKKEIWKISTTKHYRKKNEKRKGGLGKLNRKGKKVLIELIKKALRDKKTRRAFYPFFEDEILKSYLKKWLREYENHKQTHLKNKKAS